MFASNNIRGENTKNRHWIIAVPIALFKIVVTIVLGILSIPVFCLLLETLVKLSLYVYKQNPNTTILTVFIAYTYFIANHFSNKKPQYFNVSKPTNWYFLNKLYYFYYAIKHEFDNIEYSETFGDFPQLKEPLYDYKTYRDSAIKSTALTRLNYQILGKQFDLLYLNSEIQASNILTLEYKLTFNDLCLEAQINTPLDFKKFNLNHYFRDATKFEARYNSYLFSFLETKINTAKGLKKFLKYWINHGHYLSFKDPNKVFQQALEIGPFENFTNKEFLCYVASRSHDIQELLYYLQEMPNLETLLPPSTSTMDTLFKSRIYHHNYLRTNQKKLNTHKQKFGQNAKYSTVLINFNDWKNPVPTSVVIDESLTHSFVRKSLLETIGISYAKIRSQKEQYTIAFGETTRKFKSKVITLTFDVYGKSYFHPFVILPDNIPTDGVVIGLGEDIPLKFRSIEALATACLK